jgi:glycosyltransferase involved in cell wall biosynthesis
MQLNALNKSVLMVAYHYPPEGSSSGVLRTVKFSKYLPRHGWRPHVLTLRDSLYPIRDEGLLRDIPPEAVIYRTRAFDASRHLAIKGRHLALFGVPDRCVGWLPFGMARGLRVIKTVGVQALYSTSPLPTAHLIAALLKSVTGLPWIADFRDPWIEEGIHPRPGSLRFRAESRLERLVVTRADRITVTTPEFCADLHSRYRYLPKEKFSVIFNGFDEEDFRDLNDTGVPSRFEILHAGLVTPDYRDPIPFLRAVASLTENGGLPRREVRIVFLGGGAYLESPSFRRTVTDLALSDVVEVLPRIPHRDVLRRLREAAVLLLLQASDDTRSLIPAKAFEYLRVGRPILAVTLEGATAELIRTAHAGVVAHPADAEGMRRALLDFYRHGWRPGSRDNNRLIRQYERRALTGELARLLDGLVRRPPCGQTTSCLSPDSARR